MMLGCCSGPGFVVGYIGGLLLGSTSLGALLYAGQLAANLLAAGFCLPMLPKADAHGVREVPCKKEKQEISLPTAISSAASTCLDLCGCVIFFRVAAGVLLSVAPLPDSAAACVSAACEITAGCAAFAALGGKAALYGICLAMSLLGFSVWGQLRLLLQGRVPMRMLAISRLLHAVLFPLLVRLLLWRCRRSRPCSARWPRGSYQCAACRRMPLWWRRCFFAHCFTKVTKTFIIQYKYNFAR